MVLSAGSDDEAQRLVKSPACAVLTAHRGTMAIAHINTFMLPPQLIAVDKIASCPMKTAAMLMTQSLMRAANDRFRVTIYM